MLEDKQFKTLVLFLAFTMLFFHHCLNQGGGNDKMLPILQLNRRHAYSQSTAKIPVYLSTESVQFYYSGGEGGLVLYRRVPVLYP